MAKKQLTTGQRLAYMLRTAVVECQAVEAGRHPNVVLQMGDFRYRDYDGKICGCLGGVYAMMARGLKPLRPGAGMYSDQGVTQSERVLDCLREGDVYGACALLGKHVSEPIAQRCHGLIYGAFDYEKGRSPWHVYLKAASILEKA